MTAARKDHIMIAPLVLTLFSLRFCLRPGANVACYNMIKLSQ